MQLHTLLQKKSLARVYTLGRGCRNHVYINTHNIYYVNLYDSLMLPLAETQPDESYQFSFNPIVCGHGATSSFRACHKRGLPGCSNLNRSSITKPVYLTPYIESKIILLQVYSVNPVCNDFLLIKKTSTLGICVYFN